MRFLLIVNMLSQEFIPVYGHEKLNWYIIKNNQFQTEHGNVDSGRNQCVPTTWYKHKTQEDTINHIMNIPC